jgi:patatin-like phospholipase/acyl hydrolase
MFSRYAFYNGGSKYKLLVKDAAQASAAAPTYFDPKIVGEGEDQ